MLDTENSIGRPRRHAYPCFRPDEMLPTQHNNKKKRKEEEEEEKEKEKLFFSKQEKVETSFKWTREEPTLTRWMARLLRPTEFIRHFRIHHAETT